MQKPRAADITTAAHQEKDDNDKDDKNIHKTTHNGIGD